MSFETTRLLVKSILENADRFDWSIQGFGMLRTYLSKEVRLHIWNPAFVVPNVSTIHDHPWDFESLVVCGELSNSRYVVLKPSGHGNLLVEDPPALGEYAWSPMTHHVAKIQCGPGGGFCENVNFEERCLVTYIPQRIAAGYRYTQKAIDVHETNAVAGTVTIVTRKFKEDTEHARVFFPLGTDWVSAEPRRATPAERASFVQPALALLLQEQRTTEDKR